MRLGWSKRSLKFGSSATRLREAFPRERRIEPRERRDGDAGGRAQGLRRLLRHALRNAMNGRRSPIAGRCATAAFFALLSARASFPLHAPAALPRLAEGHPDLQGLWMRAPADSRGCSSDRSTGRTSPPVARGGRGGGRSPAASEYPYSGGGAGRPPETRLRSPEARCHLPAVPRALDQPGGLYPVQIIQDVKHPCRCCTKRCTTCASFRPTTVRIRATAGRGTGTGGSRTEACPSTSWICMAAALIYRLHRSSAPTVSEFRSHRL